MSRLVFRCSRPLPTVLLCCLFLLSLSLGRSPFTQDAHSPSSSSTTTASAGVGSSGSGGSGYTVSALSHSSHGAREDDHTRPLAERGDPSRQQPPPPPPPPHANSKQSPKYTHPLAKDPFAVFGYLPEYRQTPDFPYANYFSQGLTHLLFFSLEIDPVTLRLTHAEDRLPPLSPPPLRGERRWTWWEVRDLAYAYDVRLMVCVGGGGRSDGFASLVRNATARRALLDDLNALLLARELDGVDFNWEYPRGAGEWAGLAQLLLEARAALGRARLPRRRHHHLATAEVGAAPSGLRRPMWRQYRPCHSCDADKGSDDDVDNMTSHRHTISNSDYGSVGSAHAAGGEEVCVVPQWQRTLREQQRLTDAWHRVRAGLPPLPRLAGGEDPDNSSPPGDGWDRVRVRPVTLSMAFHPAPGLGEYLRRHHLPQALDYIHLMAYDFGGSIGDGSGARGDYWTLGGVPINPAGHHSPIAYAAYSLSDKAVVGALRPPAAPPSAQHSNDYSDHTRDSERTRHTSEEAEEDTGDRPRQQQHKQQQQQQQQHRFPSETRGAKKLHQSPDYRRRLTLGIPLYGRHTTRPQLAAETYERLQYFMRQWVLARRPHWARSYASTIDDATDSTSSSNNSHQRSGGGGGDDTASTTATATTTTGATPGKATTTLTLRSRGGVGSSDAGERGGGGGEGNGGCVDIHASATTTTTTTAAAEQSDDGAKAAHRGVRDEWRREEDFKGYGFVSYTGMQQRMRVARCGGDMACAASASSSSSVSAAAAASGGFAPAAGVMLWELGQDLRPLLYPAPPARLCSGPEVDTTTGGIAEDYSSPSSSSPPLGADTTTGADAAASRAQLEESLSLMDAVGAELRRWAAAAGEEEEEEEGGVSARDSVSSAPPAAAGAAARVVRRADVRWLTRLRAEAAAARAREEREREEKNRRECAESSATTEAAAVKEERAGVKSIISGDSETDDASDL